MKQLTEREWEGVTEVLELVQLRAINDTDFLRLLNKHQEIFTPEFLGLRAEICRKHKKLLKYTKGGPYCEQCFDDPEYCSKHPEELLMYFGKEAECLLCAEEEYKDNSPGCPTDSCEERSKRSA